LANLRNGFFCAVILAIALNLFCERALGVGGSLVAMVVGMLLIVNSLRSETKKR